MKLVAITYLSELIGIVSLIEDCPNELEFDLKIYGNNSINCFFDLGKAIEKIKEANEPYNYLELSSPLLADFLQDDAIKDYIKLG